MPVSSNPVPNSVYGTDGDNVAGYYSILPPGIICMWHGLLANIPGGWGLCDGTNGTPNLTNTFVKGVATNATNPGATGGSATHTPTGTNSAPAFTGTSANTNAVSAGTPAGSVTTPTISWPAGVPTASGAAVADHASHTHSVTSNVTVSDHASHTHTYTDVPNHTHGTGTIAGTVATRATSGSTLTSASGIGASGATGTAAVTFSGATANPSGGVASGTTAGPSATLTHSVTNNAVTSGGPSSTLTHSVTQPTIAWPVGVPTNSSPSFSGSALGTHQHSVTATGTVAAPVFSGDSQNTEPVYYSLAFIMKL